MFYKGRRKASHLAHFLIRFVPLLLLISLAQTAHAAAGNAKAFRLGTAALPYGWSTAIADFDSDKKPDFAIANRIGTSARGYEYSLELELSLEARQVFRFQSSDPALSIAAFDLVNDHD